jgi:hypothetical protein
MTLYSVNLFCGTDTAAKPFCNRLMPRHRAKRLVAWLQRNGFDAYISAARVNV